MKKKIITFSLFFALAILAVIFLFKQGKPHAADSTHQASLARQSDLVGGTEPGNRLTLRSQQPASYSPSPVTQAHNDPQKRQQLYREMVEEKNSPVEFYGRFVDQDGNSLAGVKIAVAVRQWYLVMTEIPSAKEIPLERTSDLSGRFELSGTSGDGFDVMSIQKDGYEPEPGPHTFGATGGSLSNPIIFKMWNTNIHEQLISGNRSFEIVPDGRSYYIRLDNDTISESGEGDLKISIQYTNQVVRGQLYDWSGNIEVVDGGLLEESLGSAMYEAPAEGYVRSFHLQQQIKGGQRGHIGQRQFFLKLKNGNEYGQMSIELYAPFNKQTPGLIQLSYVVNPSGSRILR